MTGFLDTIPRPAILPDAIPGLLADAVQGDDTAPGPAADLLEEAGFGDVAAVVRQHGPWVAHRLVAFLEANRYDPDRMELVVRRHKGPVDRGWLVYAMAEVRPHSYWLFAMKIRATKGDR